jgi:hypothetical protein
MVLGMVSAKERNRVLQRTRRYRFEGTHIFRVWEDCTTSSPKRACYATSHEELGHFGVKRTYSLLLGQYWWCGMHTDVQRLVSCCMVYVRVRALFNAPTPYLHPLPIMGLGYH